MSEPNSLYARIKISQQQRDAFLAAPPQAPQRNANWQQWWDSRDMYQGLGLDKCLAGYAGQSNEEILDSWMTVRHLVPFSEYDAAREIWHFGALTFAENYGEMLPALAFVHSMAAYAQPGADSFALIFDYIWGSSSINALIRFGPDGAMLDAEVDSLSDLDPEMQTLANDYVGQQFDAIQGVDSGYWGED